MPIQRMYVLWCDGLPYVTDHQPYHDPSSPHAKFASEVSEARKRAKADGWRVPNDQAKDQRILCPACWDEKLKVEHGVQSAEIVTG